MNRTAPGYHKTTKTTRDALVYPAALLQRHQRDLLSASLRVPVTAGRMREQDLCDEEERRCIITLC